MNSGKQISIAWYAVIDFITASLAWGCFFFIRRWLLNQPTIEGVNYKQMINSGSA